MKYINKFLSLPVILLATNLYPALVSAKCNYSLDEDSLHVEWTGFKTTQKVAVKGKFLSSKNLHKAAGSYPSLAALLKDLSVETDLKRVDSANPVRDQRLQEQFFGLLGGEGKATGELSDIRENTDHTGAATLRLEFNKKTKEIPVTFTWDSKSNFVLQGKLDVLQFSAKKALTSLSKACADLHKGADGVSKTWSEAEFSASGRISSNCH